MHTPSSSSQAKATLDWDEHQSASELCERARQGRFQAIQTLLECGVNVNTTDYDRRTALHLACGRALHTYAPALEGLCQPSNLNR